jgi:hypothetical protein
MLDIVVMDYTEFTQGGITNKEFALMGTQKPLQVTQCHFQEQFSVNILHHVFGNNLIGQHVIKGS